jgi:hypothetical protein
MTATQLPGFPLEAPSAQLRIWTSVPTYSASASGSYQGVPQHYQTTVAPEWHPHDLPTHQPCVALDAGSMSLVLAAYAAVSTYRMQTRNTEWPKVDGLFRVV